MDLYDFITDRFPFPGKNAGPSEPAKNELEPVLTETEYLRAEKQALIDKINELESSFVTLKTQRDDLETRLKKEEDELTLLRANIKTAAEATRELETKHDEALTDKLLLNNNLEKIQKDFTKFKARVKIGILIAIIFAVAVAVATAFFIWRPDTGTDKKAHVHETKTANIAAGLYPGRIDEIALHRTETESLRAEKQALIDKIAEKQALIDKINELESSFVTLKNQRDDLETRLKKEEDEIALHRTETESLRAEKQALIDKINELESSFVTLKNQRDDLETRFKKEEDEQSRLRLKPPPEKIKEHPEDDGSNAYRDIVR